MPGSVVPAFHAKPNDTLIAFEFLVRDAAGLIVLFGIHRRFAIMLFQVLPKLLYAEAVPHFICAATCFESTRIRRYRVLCIIQGLAHPHYAGVFVPVFIHITADRGSHDFEILAGRIVGNERIEIWQGLSHWSLNRTSNRSLFLRFRPYPQLQESRRPSTKRKSQPAMRPK